MEAENKRPPLRGDEVTLPGEAGVSIVLVEPAGPGNIGSVARAMKNYGFADLVLINPCEYHVNECYAMACNAPEIISGARVYPELRKGLEGFGFVVGTTRRLGKIRHPVFTLKEAIPRIIEMAGKNNVAVLFGREDRGLENSELKLCDMLVEMPSHEAYPSLNLSHAVFLLCHYLFISGDEAYARQSIEVAPREDVENMYRHLAEVLTALEYGEKGGGHLHGLILRNFRKLFGRTGLMEREVNMLRGLFSQILDRLSG